MPEETPPSLNDVLEHGRQFLARVESLAARTARERDELLTAQRQWTSERHALLEEQQRIRELQEAVNETLVRLQADFDHMEQERDRLAQQHEQDQQAFRATLEEKDAALTGERNRAGQLEGEMEALRADHRQAVTAHRTAVEQRDQLQAAHENVQAEHRRAVEALGQATGERDQLRQLSDESRRELAVAKERLTGAADEVKRLQEQVQQASRLVELKEEERRQLAATHASEALRLKEQLAAVSKDRDDLQTMQVQWSVDREQLLKKLAAAEARQVELQQEWQRSRALMAEEKAALQVELADHVTQLQDTRSRLERVTETERGLREQHEKVTARLGEVTEQSSKLAADWATRRQALAAEIHAQNQEMEQVRAEIARAQDREKQLTVKIEEFSRQQPASLSQEQGHTVNSMLNAVIGFSTVLLDDQANAVTPEERREYLKQINDSALRLADAVRRWTARPGASVTRADAPTLAGKGRKAPGILVADADPQVKERIEPFLSRAGYEMVYVKNATELMQKAASLQPLAILIDAQLPPDGAPRLVRELRRDPRTRDIPLVLTSAGQTRQPGGIGDVEFLSKPIDRQELVQLLVKFDLMADGKRARKMPSNILVVDDDRQTVNLVKAILKPFNIRVLSAENGKSAIEQALRNKPDLVLLDLVMPSVDGFEVVNALRREKDTSQVPILVHTARMLTKEERARLEGKVQSIIEKGDFHQERLLELILKRGERRNRPAERPAA